MNRSVHLPRGATPLLAGLALLVASAALSGCDTVSKVVGPVGIDKYNSALQHQQHNETALAEQDYKIALQQNPDLAEAHLNLGLLYMDSQWWDGAQQETQKAVDLLEKTHTTYVEGSTWEQSLSLAYNNLGAVEMGRGADSEMNSDARSARAHWQTGMANFDKAVQLDPTDAKAQGNLQRFKNAYR
jgi:tetratricopeptide (TPR) repeat protein